MTIEKLNTKEKQLICECLNFINRSDFVDDYEFQTRLGVERNELEKVADLCPDFDDEDSVVELCINNSFNEICNGLTITEIEWKKWFSASVDDVRKLFDKWVTLKGWKKASLM